MSIPSLKEQVEQGNKRAAVIDDALQVLDAEVADKSGLSGMAVKGAFAVVKGIQPGFIRHVVDNLLDDFLDALNPIYQEAVAAGKPAGKHLQANGGRVADALLGITDARAERAQRAHARNAHHLHRVDAFGTRGDAAARLAAHLDPGNRLGAALLLPQQREDAIDYAARIRLRQRRRVAAHRARIETCPAARTAREGIGDKPLQMTGQTGLIRGGIRHWRAMHQCNAHTMPQLAAPVATDDRICASHGIARPLIP